MASNKLCVDGREQGPARRFFKEAGMMGMVLLALAMPPNGKARAEDGMKKAQASDVASNVGHYPNFSGAGVHGNPAVWPEYGRWAFISLSGSPNQENGQISAILSSAITGNVHGLARVDFTGDEQSAKANAQGLLALSLPYTFMLGAAFGMDSTGKIAAQAGIASSIDRKWLLLRNGIDYDTVGSRFHAGSELRAAVRGFELTGSGSVSAAVSEGRLQYAGQAIGAQLRYKTHLGLSDLAARGERSGTGCACITAWGLAARRRLICICAGKGRVCSRTLIMPA